MSKDELGAFEEARGVAGEDIAEGHALKKGCRDQPGSTLGQRKGFGMYSSFSAYIGRFKAGEQ